MHLTLDIGNTRIKAALFKRYHLMRWAVIDREAAQSQLTHFLADDRPTAVTHCTVGVALNLDFLDAPVHAITAEQRLPLTLHYNPPSTLGADRVALCAAAACQFRGSNTLTISIGTCITYDIVDGSGNHLGGAIAPGLSMRLKAMANQTAALPEAPQNGPMPTWAQSTEESLRIGAWRGTLYEMLGHVKAARSQFNDLKLIVTGGDAPRFIPHLEKPIFAAPNFAHIGMNEIFVFGRRNA